MSPQSGDTSRFGDPSRAGLCEEVEVDVSSQAVAASTRDGAVARFVELHPILEETSVENSTIYFEGEAVGEIFISRTDDGDYHVERGSWCYPE